MDTRDPRHGTEAGYEQHVRDNETPCDNCTHGKIIAKRRYSKRRVMGHVYTRLIGDELHGRIVSMLDSGLRQSDIAARAGVSTSLVGRVVRDGPTQKVYTRTWKALDEATSVQSVTPIGITRRIRALQRMGYSFPLIADAAGVHKDTVLDAANTTRVFMANRVTQAIAEAYERLHMTPPDTSDKAARRSATRVRNAAARRGWAAPLAWDNDIDDPAARPECGRDRNGAGHETIDSSRVERILAGDWRLRATIAERRTVVARWTGSHNELARLTGWRVERYTDRREPAA